MYHLRNTGEIAIAALHFLAREVISCRKAARFGIISLASMPLADRKIFNDSARTGATG